MCSSFKKLALWLFTNILLASCGGGSTAPANSTVTPADPVGQTPPPTVPPNEPKPPTQPPTERPTPGSTPGIIAFNDPQVVPLN
jgi:hypothetical protein